MSGGTAYLHDPDGTAASRVNVEMVDVLPVADDDREWLRATVAEHAARTGSPLAQRLLDAWDAAPFVVVLPRDYARVLAIAEEARREGLGDDAIAARIMERVNG
jgi:glutamate synthase (NADPH/NADH) large chain